MLRTTLIALLSLATITSAETRVAPDPDPIANPQFTFGLYQQQAKNSGNFVVSPASVQIALSMADLGAAGDTKTQMDKVLGLSGEDAHATQSRLLNALAARKTGYTLSISNNLYLDQRCPVSKDFLGKLHNHYNAATNML